LEVGAMLDLSFCEGLVQLPEKLTVYGSLSLVGCTGLRGLPSSLKVDELAISKNSHEQVKKDAERMKEEGKIRGEIIEVDLEEPDLEH